MIKYPWSRDKKPTAKPKRGWWRFLRHVPSVSILSMLVLVVGVLLYPYVAVTVPSGEVGVLWKRFSAPGIYCLCILARGTVLNPAEIRGEGLHVIWPWDKLFIYDLRLQSNTEKYNAISSDGVSVTAEISIRHQLSYDSVAVFHKFIGPRYFTSLLAPEIGFQARNVISRYEAKEVYRSRQNIEAQIRMQAQNSLGDHLNQLFQTEASEQGDADIFSNKLKNSIQLLDTLVLSIELPATIVAAINNQTEQQYKITEYKFRAEREIEESKRKQIEANGIAAFQRTVSQGISDSYLRWQGIAATVALAQSPNAKIVVIGTGKDGLPIILGNVDTPSSSAQTPKPGTGDTTSPSGRSPAPTGTTSSGALPTHDGTPVDSSKAPGTPGVIMPTVLDKKPTVDSSNPFDLSDIKSLLSRLSEALHSVESATIPATGAKPKE
jgi:regulator of protease activity HflC (stomatin/prohibitin superfamily)